MEASAAAHAAATASETFNMITKFIDMLDALLSDICSIFPDCAKTAKMLTDFRRNRTKPGVEARIVKQWHVQIQDAYVPIAQTKDRDRLEAGLARAFARGFFLKNIDMLGKWKDARLAPSTDELVRVVRTLNGYAYLQHSFLGRMQGALEEIGERFASRDGALSIEAVTEIAKRMMSTLSSADLLDINRMLPHVIHVIGGMEAFDALMDEALAKDSALRPVLSSVIGIINDNKAGGAGAGGGDAGADREDEFEERKTSVDASASTEDEEDENEAIRRGGEQFKSIVRELADPDNENGMRDVLRRMGVSEDDTSSKEDFAAAFDTMRESMNGDMVGTLMETMAGYMQQHPDATIEQVTQSTTSFLSERGVDIKMDGVKRVAAAAKRAWEERR